MNNINLSLTLKSALSLLTNNSISDTIREIQQSIEAAMSRCGCGVESTHNMNLTLKSVPVQEKVRCIAAVRNTLLWGLKPSKEFVDVVVGKLDLENGGAGVYDSNGYWAPVYRGGTPNTLTESTQRVRDLAAQLSEMGCEVYTDTYNCT
jgi:ribosomal protein L7/L12